MHDFDLNRQRLVLRRDEVVHLELGAVVGILGHEAVALEYRGRHWPQEVCADELKPSRDLSLAWLVVNWLLGALLDCRCHT